MFGKNLKMSLPGTKIVHGVKIEKAPVGHYLEAMTALQDLPSAVLKELFPGKTISETLESLTAATGDTMAILVPRLLAVAPKAVVPALGKLLSVDEDVILKALTPAELLNVITAWWTVNDMSDFFRNARTLWTKVSARKNTVQRLIAVALNIGISKRELFEEYYLDEFLAVLDAHNDMHDYRKDTESEEAQADDW